MEMLPLATCVGLELGRVALAVPKRNGFSLWISTGTGVDACGHATLMSVAAPLKILEQHAHRDESREASAIAAQGADGRAFEPESNPHFLLIR